jgi:hypothetical protein
MEWRGPNCCVVAYCDHCGGPISDCTEANVAFDMLADGAFDLVHKRCTQAYDRAHPDKGMDEMRHWLVYLEHNLRFTEKVRQEAEPEARMMAEIF